MKYQWLLIIVFFIASTGCAKLGQTTISEDLLGEQSAWLDDSPKISDLPAQNEQNEEEESAEDQSKTIDLADQKSTDISVKLTAKPQKKLSDQPAPLNPINCGHSLDCDCQNLKKPSPPPSAQLPSAKAANPTATPSLGLNKQPLIPLNSKQAGDSTPARGNTFNQLRSRGTTKVLGPLAIQPQPQPQPQLKPLPIQVLTPSTSSTTNDSLKALPQQSPEKQLVQPAAKTKTDSLNSLVEPPCENCDQISCPGNCPSAETREDRGWEKLFAIDTSQSGDCPDCESDSCETKDLVIVPQDSIVMTEPPFDRSSKQSLGKTAVESTASPLVDPSKSATQSNNPIHQVNVIEQKDVPTIKRAFRPPADPIPDLPSETVDKKPSNDFIPRSKIDSNTTEPSQIPADKKIQIENSIQKLKNQLDLETDSKRRNALEVNLHLFEFLRRQLAHDGTLTSITVEEKKYWDHQLEAIEMMTQGGGEEESGKAADATLDNLRKAMNRLESIADLQIKNGAICCEITGFGQHKPFPENKFKPGHAILVYCEVENYEAKDQEINSKSVAQSRFQGSYRIANEDGQQVQSGDFPIIEDNAPQRRRDFYLYFKIVLNELKPGNYRLQMEIEDLNGQKKGNLEQDLLFMVQ